MKRRTRGFLSAIGTRPLASANRPSPTGTDADESESISRSGYHERRLRAYHAANLARQQKSIIAKSEINHDLKEIANSSTTTRQAATPKHNRRPLPCPDYFEN
jgi:hypothetical protein